jgi:hypothetical protein
MRRWPPRGSGSWRSTGGARLRTTRIRGRRMPGSLVRLSGSWSRWVARSWLNQFSLTAEVRSIWGGVVVDSESWRSVRS